MHAFDKTDIVVFENKVKALTCYFITETWKSTRHNGLYHRAVNYNW